MNQTVDRCPRCKRILFRTSAGQLPPHKLPEPTPTYAQIKAVPLTATNAPWCNDPRFS